jgi:hypothetical protein
MRAASGRRKGKAYAKDKIYSLNSGVVGRVLCEMPEESGFGGKTFFVLTGPAKDHWPILAPAPL